ncbi:MAG: MYG1 family protein [Solobacterium sp.]|nr:MYG1 family protein [Solobacterium sp.]
MRDYLKLYTHDGQFHADEVFATAMFSLMCEDYEVVRGSDTTLPDDTWIIYDIGGGELDHHTPENKENNGTHYGTNVPYAACGLVWRKYYKEILEYFDCEERYLKTVYQRIENSLVIGIDAADNGFDIVADVLSTMPNVKDDQKEKIIYEAKTGFTISGVIKDFNPPWNSDMSHDDAFKDAVSFARDILINRIDSVISSLDGRDYVNNCIAYSANHIMIMEQFAPWEGVLYGQYYNPKANDIWYVISPALRGGWNVQCALLDPSDRTVFRHPLPSAWNGLRYEELEKVSGIKGAVFVHPSGFLAGAATEEAALEMARLAARK